MKKGKQVAQVCAMGASLGLTLSVLITIVISLMLGDGRFYAVVPELIEDCGSEIGAVILQTALSFLYGAAFAGAGLIWRREDWSLARQAVTHLVICSLATFPVAWVCRWMPRSAGGAALYFAIFFGVYLLVWLLQFWQMKRRIREMNRNLDARREQ